MTPRPRKPRLKLVEESGIPLRMYEREAGSLLCREVRLDGGKDRKSLGHRDRELPNSRRARSRTNETSAGQ